MKTEFVWTDELVKEYTIYGKVFSSLEEFKKSKEKDYGICQRHMGNIVEVKRLSDNEVFTVGDLTDRGKIIEFIEFLSQMWVIIGDVFGYKLAEIKKIKPVLFTTKDGVAIHDWHTTVFTVNPAWCIGSMQAGDYISNNKGLKYFSTEQAANYYVRKNMLSLSLKDLRDLSLYSGDTNMLINVKDVEKLINSRC